MKACPSCRSKNPCCKLCAQVRTLIEKIDVEKQRIEKLNLKKGKRR